MPTTTNHDNQIAAFLARQPYVDAATKSSDEPQVIFKGALDLDVVQENNLVQAALKYREELLRELGADATHNIESEDIPTDPALDSEGMTWMQERCLWDLVYRQRMGWRRRVWGGIFSQGQNIHFPLTRRTVQQMISRAQNYFFQTEPWFAATPIGMDPDPAKVANEWTQYKFEAAKLRPTLEKAIELAFIRGETVLRVDTVERSSHFEAFESVAMYAENEPYQIEGEYIFESDIFLPNPSGGIIHANTQTVFEQPPVFETIKIQRKLVEYAGPEAKILPYRDFLAPKTAESLDSADCLVYEYDLPAIEIVEQYIARVQKSGGFDEQEYPQVMAYLADAAASPMRSLTAANRPRSDLGETTGSTQMAERGDPMVKLAEFCMWIDANNDGKRENVYLLLDLETQRPILYDYVENVFPDRKRPYRVVRINPIDGRWYGTSAVEMFWPMQKAIDLAFNRWDLANSSSGSVTFWSPELTVEGAANPKLMLNAGNTYRKVNQQTKGGDIVERIPLYEFKGAQMETIAQYYMQIASNMSGVANANDSQAAGLESSKLATGIRNIDRSGQEQFAPLLSHLSEGITEICETSLVIAVRGMDEEESFEVLGKNGVLILKQLKQADVRMLKWHVNLELTRYRAEQEEQQAQSAINVALGFYTQVPVPLQVRLAPLFRQQLKGYGVRNVDEIISLPSAEEVAAASAQPAEAAQGQPAPTPGLGDLTSVKPA